MNIALDLRPSIREVGAAIRRPEELATRWRDRAGGDAPPATVFLVLLVNAAVCTAAYGMTMHMHRGLAGMVEGAVFMPLAAGIAWTLAFPALYIINSMLGSKLDFSSTLLAAAITVSFGATAMLASIPINWFFSLALPFAPIRWLVNMTIFAGVGFCMSDVFLRVMRALEAQRSRFYALVWLGLLTCIGFEFFWLFGVFSF